MVTSLISETEVWIGILLLDFLDQFWIRPKKDDGGAPPKQGTQSPDSFISHGIDIHAV